MDFRGFFVSLVVELESVRMWNVSFLTPLFEPFTICLCQFSSSDVPAHLSLLAWLCDVPKKEKAGDKDGPSPWGNWMKGCQKG